MTLFRSYILSLLLGTSLCVVSCGKADLQPLQPEGRTIAFSVDRANLEFDTKATVVDNTSLQSGGFNVSATTGSAGSEANVWNNVSFTRNGGYFSGGKFWPATNPNYHFYASNAAITFNANGCTVAATNATDVVCAYNASPYFNTTNLLTFNHIFARIGNVTVSAQDGYTVTGISVNIYPKTGGIYNIRTGNNQTDGTGWSSVSTASTPTNIASATPNTQGNDLYLVPGTYSLSVSWTASKGGVSDSYTKTLDGVSIVGGKVNAITLGLSGDIDQVKFAASVTEWGSNELDTGVLEKNQVDESEVPLYFDIITGGTITWSCTNTSVARNLSYSKNDCETWTSFGTSTVSGRTLSVSAGDRVYFTGSGSTFGNSSYYNYFGGTATFRAGGNIMSLINNASFSSLTTIPSDYCFKRLFYGCSGLVSATNLCLPATTLRDYCYQEMFGNCTSLTVAPELPATSMTSYCYDGMFSNCTSLVMAPELPATTVNGYCYRAMFDGCTSLALAPELPAASLDVSCYENMFRGTALVACPELPATTLSGNCYKGMFKNCTSLTIAPALPAATMQSACYQEMFSGCTSLASAPKLPSTSLASYCYYCMFDGCSALTVAPKLPATSMAVECYTAMFRGTGLTETPDLPATTLANSCYYFMFYECTSLTKTMDRLPATTLASHCYEYMFGCCTSLTAGPELPATTLVEGCYKCLFHRCSNLNYIKAMFTTTPSATYTDDWVWGVASSGTFVRNSAATWSTSIGDENGIPDGWTVLTASE